VAQQDNVIEIIITAQSLMAKGLADAQGQLLALKQSTDRASVSTAGMTHESVGLHRAIIPLAGSVRQLTSLTAQLHPEFRLAISSLDNLSFAMVRAAAGGASLSASLLAALKTALNPVTLAVLAAVTAIGMFVSKLMDAKKAKEEFDMALRTGNLGFFNAEILKAQINVEKAAQAVVEAQNKIRKAPALTGMPGEEAQFLDAEKLRKLTEALTKAQTEYAKALGIRDKLEVEGASRQAEDLQFQLEAQRKLIGLEGDALELQKTQNAIDELRRKKLDPDLQREVEALIKGNTALGIKAAHTKALAEIERARWAAMAAEMDKAEEEERDIFAPDFENKVAAAIIAGNLKILESIRDTVRQSGEAWDDMQEDALVTANALELIFSRMRDKQKEREEQLDREEMERLFSLADLIERAKQEQEQAATEMARSFTDRFIAMMESGKFDMASMMRDLARTVVSEFIEEALATLILSAGIKKGSIGGGLFQWLFGLFGSSTFPDLGAFAFSGGEVMGKGGYLSGNFMPVGTLRQFQHGGVARGPTLGVIGEEGPEIVARMKPARAGDLSDRVSVIIQGDIIPRQPNMRPQDVVLVVADDMERGGKTARAAINLQKRR